MDSAIPDHLLCRRTQPSRAGDAYMPSYAAWTARLPANVEQLTMAYFGVQRPAHSSPLDAFATINEIAAFFAAEGGPGHFDIARYTDEAGFPTYVAITYWTDPESFAHWTGTSGIEAWFEAVDRRDAGLGIFREILSPRATHFETIFSTPDKFEGAALLAKTVSGEFREHGYWGGMRDRLPVSQTDPLTPSGLLERTEGRRDGRIRVTGHDNLALIRSGQDWTATLGTERTVYLGEVEPVLRKGMDFLRTEGLDAGCYFNRSVRLLDPAGNDLEKTFSVSAWRSLEHLERWSSSHPTHVAIYGTFMRMVDAMNGDLRLRLYHEVVVLSAAEQFYEYINCHENTGLLRAIAT